MGKEWWEAAPLADAKAAPGNWWDAAPIAPEAGGGRGFVNPPPGDPTDVADDDSSHLVTAKQLGRDLRGGVEQVKGLARATGAFGGAASWKMWNQTLADMDAIDATGKPLPRKPDALGASQLTPYAESYSLSDPTTRQKIREKVATGMSRDEGFIADSVKAVEAYSAEQKRLSGKIPDFTDIRGPTDFANWLTRTGVSTTPTMAAAMLGAVAGPLGFAVTSGGMAIGDLTQARIEHTSKANDPALAQPSERAEVAANRNTNMARDLAGNVDTTAALAVPYAALDKLGPVGSALRGPAKTVVAQGAKQILKKGLRDLPREMGEEIINEGGQEVVNVAGDILNGERSHDLTTADALRVANSAAAGAAAVPGGHAANVAREVVADARKPDPIHNVLAAGSVDEAIVAANAAIVAPVATSVPTPTTANPALDTAMAQAMQSARVTPATVGSAAIPQGSLAEQAAAALPTEATNDVRAAAVPGPGSGADGGAVDAAGVLARDGRPVAEPVPAVPEGTAPVASEIGDAGRLAAGNGEALASAPLATPAPTLAERVEAMRAKPAVQADTRPSTEIRSRGIPADAAHITTTRDPEAVKAHPDYTAAKAGDPAAAERLVRDQVTPADIEAAKSKIGEGAIWVYPHAEESTGRNVIPAMLTGRYATETGGLVDHDIVQTNQAFHTGAGAMERMSERPTFDGPVEPGQRHALVDDVTTMGGTMSELANHIQAGGGKVVGIVTLANASRSPTMAPGRHQVSEIERRYGQAIRDIFHVEPAALTRDEATYVLGFKDADALRNRVASAAQARDERLRAKGLRQEAGLTPEPSRPTESRDKAPPAEAPAPENAAVEAVEATPSSRSEPRPDQREQIDLRKRESVLQSILKCLQ